jgi:hypothetical protein
MSDVLKLFIDGQITRKSFPKERKQVLLSGTNSSPWLVPPGDLRLAGRTYEQWAGDWLRWALPMPPTNSAGAVHPWIDSPRFDVTESQTDDVWFLGAPFGKTQRHCVIPSGKALFFPLFVVECSSIEAPPFYASTVPGQATMSQYWGDHIMDPFCELDGNALTNLDAFRFQSPQVSITAPAPWILGKDGGNGTSTGDGYFIFLAPLPPGPHKLRFGGAMVLTKGDDPTPADQRWEIDITYHLTVVESPEIAPLSRK